MKVRKIAASVMALLLFTVFILPQGAFAQEAAENKKLTNFTVGLAYWSLEKPTRPPYQNVAGATITLTNNDTKDVITFTTYTDNFESVKKVPAGTYTFELKSVPEEIRGKFVMPAPKTVVVAEGTPAQFDAFNVVQTIASVVKPEVAKEVVNVGEKVDLTDNVTNLDKLPKGTKVEDVTPEGAIDINKPGEYTGKIKVTYRDNSSEIVDVAVTVLEKTTKPSITAPKAGDKTISGTSEPNAKVVVELPDGTKVETTADKDGKWTAKVPEGKEPREGQTIKATATVDGKAPSEEAKVTVKGKDNGGFWFIPGSTTTPSVEKPKHETAIHKLYIYGYEDNSFRPEGNMTRAEAAAMIARLQGLDLSNKARPGFIDVRSGWYNAVVNAVVNAGYMKGYPDGTFRPNGKITRAEFAQMIKAIDKANTGMAPFADAKGHWAEAAINQAYANERITGYPDGTFRPNNHITRAEAVTVFNKLYDRCVGEPGLADVKGRLVEFNDINRSHWAYFQVVESSNTHEFYRTEKGKIDETWVRVLQTWKEALANR